ncbi:MAG: coenzyme F(420) biosynthesis enzyme [Selenomonadaceae bacterium]|nr:coenzyme F(420) biosynthesis enzyme [Selenomonadaceae bacterium]
MTKFLKLLVLTFMFAAFSAVAFAHSDRETIAEGADLSSVHRIALGWPLYIKAEETDLSDREVIETVFGASKVARTYVISYDDAVKNIKSSNKVDISVLDKKKAAAEFKKYIKNHADAYVILTVANNSRLTLFFDVYQAGTDNLLYTYQIEANRSDKSTKPTYNTLSEQFYKHFERAANEQQKKNAKKK